ncbi:MAG TPA: phosphatase PAP2 family protein [Xanthobacteraceae bacterium]|nr:phosphatase PAP2 family protein [Xanthobacteraceae bacterium]
MQAPEPITALYSSEDPARRPLLAAADIGGWTASAQLALLTWAAVATTLLASVILAEARGFTFAITGQSVGRAILLVAAPLGFALYGRLRRMRWLEAPFHCFAQFAAFSMAALFLQYPLASLGFPAQDDFLTAIDEALGFNWKVEFLAIFHRPGLFSGMVSTYQALLWQVPIACFIVGLYDPRRLQLFATANTIALGIALALSTLFPAASAFHYYGSPIPVSAVAQFLAVRDGSLRVLDPAVISGIITFPSYHTILALLVGWAFAGVRRIFVFVVVFEAAIIISTRVVGGHYLTDMAAGALIAAFAVWCAQWLARRLDGLRRENPNLI